MTPDRLTYSAENCSIKRTLDIVGERWTLLVLREAFYGVRRFEDFVQMLGCPRDILSRRLRTLVEHGVLERRAYREPGMRERSEYRLTEKGLDLAPALLALMQWGDRWECDADGPAIEPVHAGCGAPITVNATCSKGHGPLSAREIDARPGRGAKLAA